MDAQLVDQDLGGTAQIVLTAHRGVSFGKISHPPLTLSSAGRASQFSPGWLIDQALID
jgi:hypothetical protein